MSQMFCRERRSWTAKEDQLLREAVQKEDPDNSNPSKWHAIAKHVPNRTNKDCRKRWFAKMASDVVKGGWAPDEDEKLVKGIERYGTRWSLVASVVQTRNSDQCAKRWTDTLNPAIDRTTWTAESDEHLLRAVAEHGKVWTKIVKTYFPGRTGLSAKNRYNSITRFNSDRARPRRKSSETTHYITSRKAGSVSSSSSASPQSPAASLPYMSPSSYPNNSESKPAYRIDDFPSWSSSSSVTSEEIQSYRSSPTTFEYLPENPTTAPSTPSTEGSYQSYDIPMNHTVPTYSGHSHSQVVFSASSPPISSTTIYKTYPNHPRIQQESQNYSTYSQYPITHASNDASDHFVFDNISANAESAPVIGVNWEANSKVANNNYKVPTSDYAYSF